MFEIVYKFEDLYIDYRGIIVKKGCLNFLLSHVKLFPDPKIIKIGSVTTTMKLNYSPTP